MQGSPFFRAIVRPGLIFRRKTCLYASELKQPLLGGYYELSTYLEGRLNNRQRTGKFGGRERGFDLSRSERGAGDCRGIQAGFKSSWRSAIAFSG
jgi:hypothetical protein